MNVLVVAGLSLVACSAVVLFLSVIDRGDKR